MQYDPQTLDPHPETGAAICTFPARLDTVPETARFVEGFCASHGIGRDDRLRLALIVEELVSNTIRHGHRAESDAPIVIALSAAADAITLRYEDTAPAFDLVAALSDAKRPLDEDFDLRPVGNVGLRLLAHYADTVRHAHENGRNRVTLTLRRSA